ncbi:alkene reductase [Lewinella sp. W8]|uniref:alkene reductase n=1 Tax=Lewinella sp. W8 TaxID=2528208 RepID=UPI00106729EE|nr:alkene reductase [Lewinella sp. W8]MTB52338.1 alkene reductase [Lewinella sp. W8]
MSNKLFTTYTLGEITLSNRAVMAPMTRSRALDNVPNELMATYYGQRAGAGLIITEGTSPSPNGLGYPRIPGCFNEDQVAGWKLVTEAVHQKGGKIFLQIMHTGRVSHPDNLPAGGRVVGPSPIALEQTKMYVDGQGELPVPFPEAMSAEDIDVAIKEYVNCAKLAIKAGFDGVELHGANGYLIDQFINPLSNQRKDEYGGSIENRLRFARQVAEAVVAAIGKERTGIRISPYGVFNELGAFDDVDETFVALAKMVSELGLVYLHLVDHSGMGAPAVPDSIKADLRKAFSGTFILSGNYDAERAHEDLSADKGDLVAFGRPYIANPDLVERFKQGVELATPDFDTFYTPGPEGYTDYPTYEEATESAQ